MVVSPAILGEVERVIHYPRIQEQYELSEASVDQFLQSIGEGALIVEPSIKLSVVEKDPSDDRYLECAVAGSASYIVTGDTHLLDLKEHQGIRILDPREFLTVLALEGEDQSP